MTKPSRHHFNFDGPVPKDNPSIVTRAIDFILPTLLALVGGTVGYIWFG